MEQKEFVFYREAEYHEVYHGDRTGEGDQTFAYYCDSWLSANCTCLKISSLIKYERDIEKHIIPFFGMKQLCEITSEDVSAFTKMLLYERELSPKTVRNILALFRSIFMYARKKTGLWLPELEIVYPRESRKAVRILSEKEETEFVRFLAKEMDIFKFGVYMALRTGMRIGEICALKWCDISFEANTISICRTAQRIKSMDENTDTKTKIVIGTPKSESSNRVIPLMPDIAALCIRFCPTDPETFVLTGVDQCMDPRKLQRRLKGYTERCGMEEVHFHTLRHTFATRCVEAGFDVKTLSEILGHSNIGITMNQYVHPNMDLKRENMSRLKTVLPF